MRSSNIYHLPSNTQKLHFTVNYVGRKFSEVGNSSFRSLLLIPWDSMAALKPNSLAASSWRVLLMRCKFAYSSTSTPWNLHRIKFTLDLFFTQKSSWNAYKLRPVPQYEARDIQWWDLSTCNTTTRTSGHLSVLFSRFNTYLLSWNQDLLCEGT